MKDRRFIDYEPDKPLDLPPDIRKWLPQDHLAPFVSDVVDALDISEITDQYHHLEGGRPAYHPRMMLKLLFYGYCVGIRSSRRIELKTYEDVAFRVLSCDSRPDHSRIWDFRKRHLGTISCLFVQVLEICKESWLVKLGHVALDGTKMKANASKHKAMRYGRMVNRLLKEAEALDEKEDKKYGKGKRGDEIPDELRFKTKRLAKIREAKRALEQEDCQEAESNRKGGKDGKPPEDGESGPWGIPDVKPQDNNQRNFTDPESRIMFDGATKAFSQGYNAQAAVDCDSQVIVSADVTQQANDKQQLIPMLEQIEENLGEIPDRVLADSGYFTQQSVKSVVNGFMEPFTPRERKKHDDPPEPAPRGRIPDNTSVVDRALRRLKTRTAQRTYSKRKESVEPVFGQIKENRGIRASLLRGLAAVKGEWKLICLTHNVLKLWRHLWLDRGRSARVFA
jgi:transposase